MRKEQKDSGLTCENAYYCTFITISPKISLEGTDHVKGIIGENKRVKLENKAELKIEQGETNGILERR